MGMGVSDLSRTLGRSDTWTGATAGRGRGGGKLMRYGWAVVAVVDRKEQISFFSILLDLFYAVFFFSLFYVQDLAVVVGSTMVSLGVV
jgi:hypothetical protein